jgi:hypothetical protein
MAGKKDVEELEAEIVKTSATTTTKKLHPSDTKPVSGDPSDEELAQQFASSPVPPSSETTNTVPTVVTPPSPPQQAVTIPTIMITDRDGKELIRMQQEIDAQSHSSAGSGTTTLLESTGLQIKIDIESLHSLLMSELFGNQQYPKVWMTKSVIYAYSKGLWGAYFKTVKGDDWQMYLIDKRDLTSVRLIPHLTIRNSAGFKQSTSYTLLQSPEVLYKNVLKRKCPKYIKPSKDGKIVQMMKSKSFP